MPPLDDEHISAWVVMIIGLIVLMCLGILVLILVSAR